MKKIVLGVGGSRSYSELAKHMPPPINPATQCCDILGVVILSLQELGVSVNMIVSGGSVGPDTWAVNVASDLSIPVEVITPNYSRHGQIAPLIRNEHIVKESDAYLAFYDGSSGGTLHTIKWCKKLKVPVYVYSHLGDVSGTPPLTIARYLYREVMTEQGELF